MKEAIRIRNPVSVLPLLRRWRNCRYENFLAITLNGAHDVIRLHHITKGIATKTIVHPRECFYPIIKDFAVAVIFVHNHPSGSANPSQEDDDITKRLSMASEIMGINLLDHIIITPHDNFYSYRQDGKITGNHQPYELEELVASLRNDYRKEN